MPDEFSGRRSWSWIWLNEETKDSISSFATKRTCRRRKMQSRAMRTRTKVFEDEKIYQDLRKNQCDSVRRQKKLEGKKARNDIAHEGVLTVLSIHQKCFSKCKVTRKLVIWRRRDQILMIQNSWRLRNRTCYQRDEIEYFVRMCFFIVRRSLEGYILFKDINEKWKNTFSKMTFSDQVNSKNKRRVKRRT